MSHPSFEFQHCQEILKGIQNGTTTYLGITNETLRSTGWIWEGPIVFLKDEILRASITAITYKGKRATSVI